jgi:hypothetical protein
MRGEEVRTGFQKRSSKKHPHFKRLSKMCHLLNLGEFAHHLPWGIDAPVGGLGYKF